MSDPIAIVGGSGQYARFRKRALTAAVGNRPLYACRPEISQALCDPVHARKRTAIRLPPWHDTLDDNPGGFPAHVESNADSAKRRFHAPCDAARLASISWDTRASGKHLRRLEQGNVLLRSRRLARLLPDRSFLASRRRCGCSGGLALTRFRQAALGILTKQYGGPVHEPALRK